MDHRRQMLNNNMEAISDTSQRDSLESPEQTGWPWPYPNMTLPPYNTIPIGYPTWPPNPPFWFPNSPSYIPEAAAPCMPTQAYPGMEYVPMHNLPWPMWPHQPGLASQTPCQVRPCRNCIKALRRCNRAKRKRTKYNDQQLAVFEKAFKKSQNPSPGERFRLETKTGVSEHKIKIWFQNRRSKERRGTEKGGESKELMTTESNLEVEDEKQLNSICEETYEKDGEIEDQNTPSDIKSLIPEAVDSRESYQNQNGDTRKNQNNTSGNMEVSEEKTNIPSYMVLTLPCGTIAVESNDLYRRKMDETQINKNIACDKKIHPKSLLTNTSTEVKVPYARETPAVDVNGIYRNEFKDTRSSEDNADQDVNLIHTQVQSDAAVDESRENNADQVVEVRHTEVQNNVAQYGAQERSSKNGKAQGLEQLHTDVENDITQYEVQKTSSENGRTQKVEALRTEVQNNVNQSSSQDRSSKNGTAQGVEVLHSEVERNAAPDTGGAAADEIEGLYCSETLNTSSFLPPLQPTTSCFDEIPRNRVSVGADKVPDAMTTPLSSNDVINSIEKNIDNAENRDDDVSQKVEQSCNSFNAMLKF